MKTALILISLAVLLVVSLGYVDKLFKRRKEIQYRRTRKVVRSMNTNKK
jgi:hypothetical protein